MNSLLSHWKTTAAGILSFLIATLTTLTAFQVPAALVPNANRTLMYWTVGANLAMALFRVWLGMIQNDALPPTQAVTQSQLKAVGIEVPAQVDAATPAK
jgi:hypothetical protein